MKMKMKSIIREKCLKGLLIVHNPQMDIIMNSTLQAQVLEIIEYWISKPSAKEYNGKRWTYITLKDWKRDYFPKAADNTIRKALNALKEKGVITVERLHPNKWVKTLSYSINYDVLLPLIERTMKTIWKSERSYFLRKTE